MTSSQVQTLRRLEFHKDIALSFAYPVASPWSQTMIATTVTSKRNMAHPESVGRSSILSSIPCSYNLVYAEVRASEERPIGVSGAAKHSEYWADASRQ
jgi:hypothetical protein